MVWMTLLANFSLFFHTPILKPNFHLSLGQSDRVGDFNPPLSGQILAVAVLLLKLERLLA
jgi:hypothetical protein